MICPRCMTDNTSPVGNSHYVCNKKGCVDENGKPTQFRVIYDTEKRFPYNEIFPDRKLIEFFKKPYLKV